MKQKISIIGALKEATRRYKQFHSGEVVTEAWTGLGFISDYKDVIKAGYMVWHDNETPPPRCMGWLTLTDKGISEIMSNPTIYFEEVTP